MYEGHVLLAMAYDFDQIPSACDVVQIIQITQQRFPNSTFKDPNLNIHIPLMKMKIVNRWKSYFCKFWHLIHWNLLTNARNMVISMLMGQILNMTPKPIDWDQREFTPTAAANTECVLLMTAKFKSVAWKCDWTWRSINHEEWNQLKGHFEELSHTIKLQIWNWRS